MIGPWKFCLEDLQSLFLDVIAYGNSGKGNDVCFWLDVCTCCNLTKVCVYLFGTGLDHAVGPVANPAPVVTALGIAGDAHMTEPSDALVHTQGQSKSVTL